MTIYYNTHTHTHHTFILLSFLLTTKAVIWVSMNSRSPGMKAANTPQDGRPPPIGLMTKFAVVLPDAAANKLWPAMTFGTTSFFVGYPTIWSIATQIMTDNRMAKLLTWRRICCHDVIITSNTTLDNAHSLLGPNIPQT